MSLPGSPSVVPLPRHLAVGLLLCLGCILGANHVAARLAFDHGAGVLLAVMLRSGGTLLVLAIIVLSRREPLRLPGATARWQLLLGLLIALQSLCLYSAVARIPVAVALLVANVFPLLLALLSWLLGGPRPTARTLSLMSLIVFGLLLVLDVPGRVLGAQPTEAGWLPGVLLAFCAALAFASALWVTDRKLSAVRGPVRSMLTMLVVLIAASLAGAVELLPGGLTLPREPAGWYGLAALVVLYGTGFTTLFVSMPRLDMPHNAPALNVEPLATLLLGWLLLGQALEPIQLVGGLIVVCAIVLLTYRRG
ncbi:EamA family transporter [Pseudomonas sp. S5(2021)]|uniref:EamA family transporter n=1 Tax=Stutzerimonas balearica TaxID=74829 RepID=UPI001CC581DB|nr:EamA family transporter [Stutzerimonas balearica]MBZ5757456.1 EamA family transporter [Pseudomonas sp. S5(2021)]